MWELSISGGILYFTLLDCTCGGDGGGAVCIDMIIVSILWCGTWVLYLEMEGMQEFSDYLRQLRVCFYRD